MTSLVINRSFSFSLTAFYCVAAIFRPSTVKSFDDLFIVIHRIFLIFLPFYHVVPIFTLLFFVYPEFYFSLVKKINLEVGPYNSYFEGRPVSIETFATWYM